MLCTIASVSATTAAIVINNGDFGTEWSTTNQPGGSGNWYFIDGTTTPLSGDTVAGPAEGLFFAVTDLSRPGAHALTRSFTVPASAISLEVTFKMFVDSYGGRTIGSNLEYAGASNQHARVDILRDGASAFDTSAVGVLTNLYLGTDAGNTANPYKAYQFNLTGILTPGQTYQLRFADVANQGLLHMGVDAVYIVAEVPEPSSYMFFALGLGLLWGARRRLQRQ